MILCLIRKNRTKIELVIRASDTDWAQRRVYFTRARAEIPSWADLKRCRHALIMWASLVERRFMTTANIVLRTVSNSLLVFTLSIMPSRVIEDIL